MSKRAPEEHGPTDPAKKRYLFVAGCPRSGTTALTGLLNASPDIALGLERFKRVKDVTEDHFAVERFLNPSENETNILAPEHYEMLSRKFSKPSSPAVLGDKTPGYFRRLEQLQLEFPAAYFVVIWRDPLSVASSFEFRSQRASAGWSEHHDHTNAVKQWNESLSRTIRFIERHPGSNVFLVKYEWLFSGDKSYLNALFNFLGLELGDEIENEYRGAMKTYDRVRKKSNILSSAQQSFVRSNTDWQLDRRANELSAIACSKLLANSATSIELGPVLPKYLEMTAKCRHQQLKAIGAHASDNEPEVVELTETKAVKNTVQKFSQRVHSLEQQLISTETSVWSRIGRTLALITRIGRRTAHEKSLSEQVGQLRQSIDRFADSLSSGKRL